MNKINNLNSRVHEYIYGIHMYNRTNFSFKTTLTSRFHYSLK